MTSHRERSLSGAASIPCGKRVRSARTSAAVEHRGAFIARNNVNVLEYSTYRDVYQRVLATKRRVDPDDVFTPNEFALGFEMS